MMDATVIDVLRANFQRSQVPFDFVTVRTAIEIIQAAFRRHQRLPLGDLYADPDGPLSLETVLIEGGIGEHTACLVIDGLVEVDCLREVDVVRAPQPSPSPSPYSSVSDPTKTMLCHTEKLWEIPLGELKAAAADRTRATRSASPFVPTSLQAKILDALNGRALKKQPLADKVCKREGSRLYRKGGIHELREAGLVDHKYGVGYFRPDAPPKSTSH